MRRLEVLLGEVRRPVPERRREQVEQRRVGVDRIVRPILRFSLSRTASPIECALEYRDGMRTPCTLGPRASTAIVETIAESVLAGQTDDHVTEPVLRDVVAHTEDERGPLHPAGPSRSATRRSDRQHRLRLPDLGGDVSPSRLGHAAPRSHDPGDVHDDTAALASRTDRHVDQQLARGEPWGLGQDPAVAVENHRAAVEDELSCPPTRFT